MMTAPSAPSPDPLVDVRGLLIDLKMWSEKPSDTPVRPSRASLTYPQPQPVSIRGGGEGVGQYTVPLSVSPDNHSNSPISSPLAGESFLYSQEEARERKIDPLERQRQASAENIAVLGEFSRLVQGQGMSNKDGREEGRSRESVGDRDGVNNREGVNSREGVNNREGSVRGGMDEKKDAGPYPTTTNNNNNNNPPSRKEEAVAVANRVESAVTTFLHSHPDERDNLRQVQASLGPSAAVDRMLALQHENERYIPLSLFFPYPPPPPPSLFLTIIA